MIRRLARTAYRLAASLLKRWGPRFIARAASPPRHVRRILVVRMWAVGELVMASPVLRTLREHHPDARIDLLVGRDLAPLTRALPWIDSAVVVDEKPLLSGSPRAWWRLVRTLRQQRYDLGLCLHQSVLLAALLWLGGVRWRVGFDRDGEGFCHHVRVPCNIADRHQVREYLATTRALGLEPADEVPALHPDEEAIQTAHAVLFDRSAAAPAEGSPTHPGGLGGTPGGERLIGIAPTGGHNVAASQLGTNVHLKRWPPDAYVELARQLAPQARIVILGGAAEAETARRIRERVPQAIDLTGRLDLATLAAVCARLDVLVTNDSGPMHVAAASGTRVFAIFGPTDARLTGPWSPHATVLTHPVPCSPCFRRDTVPPTFPDCAHQRCMREITPAEVARRLFREASTRPPCDPPYELQIV